MLCWFRELIVRDMLNLHIAKQFLDPFGTRPQDPIIKIEVMIDV